MVKLDPNTVPPEWYKALIYGAGVNAVAKDTSFHLIDVGDIEKGGAITANIQKVYEWNKRSWNNSKSIYS